MKLLIIENNLTGEKIAYQYNDDGKNYKTMAECLAYCSGCYNNKIHIDNIEEISKEIFVYQSNTGFWYHINNSLVLDFIKEFKTK